MCSLQRRFSLCVMNAYAASVSCIAAVCVSSLLRSICFYKQHTIFFIHPSVSALGCFQLLAPMTDALKKSHMHVLLTVCVLACWVYAQGQHCWVTQSVDVLWPPNQFPGAFHCLTPPTPTPNPPPPHPRPTGCQV